MSMNVSSEEVFATIGRLHVENTRLQQQNAALCAANADLLGQLKAARDETPHAPESPSVAEERAHAAPAGANGQSVKD